jgi:DUF1680 family protein
MRTLSSFEHLLATATSAGIVIAQWAASSIEASVEGGPVRLAIVTDYPWGGRIDVTVVDTPAVPWALDVRAPAWAAGGSLRVGESPARALAEAGWDRVERQWMAGDRLLLELPMQTRTTSPDFRIDALRGCVAIERGPLVYCLEESDVPADISIEGVAISPAASAPENVDLPGPLSGSVGVRVSGSARTPVSPGWPYRDRVDVNEPSAEIRHVEATLVPYLAWANREPGAMRVWLPLDRPEPGSHQGASAQPGEGGAAS